MSEDYNKLYVTMTKWRELSLKYENKFAEFLSKLHNAKFMTNNPKIIELYDEMNKAHKELLDEKNKM